LLRVHGNVSKIFRHEDEFAKQTYSFLQLLEL